MQDKIKVSVIVPVYNVEKYIRECLESLLSQTMKECEFICINDGSTDNSGLILNEFEHKDPRFKVVNKENTGYGATMNLGLDLAKGEFIGIVESDDFAEKDMFESLYKVAVEQNVEVVRSNFWGYQKGAEKKYCYMFPPPLYNKTISPFDCPQVFRIQAIWTGLYRRHFLNKNGIRFNETPGASYQDVSFNFKVMAESEKIYLLDKAFLNYREDNPYSSVKSPEKVYAIFDEFAEISQFLEKRHCDEMIFRYILSAMKPCLYEWHYNRINYLFKISFLKRVIADYQSDKALEYMNETYWNRNEWITVQKILSNPNEYLHKHEERVRELIEFIRCLNQTDSLVFWGAKKTSGYEMIKKIVNFSGKHIFFIDSNEELYGTQLDSYDILPPDTLKGRNDAFVVVLAYNHYKEISSVLEKYGYKAKENYVSVQTLYLPGHLQKEILESI